MKEDAFLSFSCGKGTRAAVLAGTPTSAAPRAEGEVKPGTGGRF